MRPQIRGGDVQLGGVKLVGYPVERIYEEVAFISYYFHWPHDEIMEMDHRERRKWCDEISKIHKKVNNEPENVFDVFSKKKY